MGRLRIRALIAAVVSAALAGAVLPLTPPAAQAADAHTTKVVAGIAQLATVVDGLGQTGKFATALPGTSVVPAQAFAMNDLWQKAVVALVTGANPQTLDDFNGIHTPEGGVELEPGGRRAFVGIKTMPLDGSVHKIDVTALVEREVDGPLDLTAASNQAKLRAPSGFVTDAWMSLGFELHYDTASSQLWVANGADTPRIAMSAASKIADVSKIDAGIGLLRVRVTESDYALHHRLIGGFADGDGDNRLYFDEASAAGPVPGELRQPIPDIARVDPSQESATNYATGTVRFDTRPLALPTITMPTISASVAARDGDLYDAEPTAYGGSGLGEYTRFLALTPDDLLGGVAQLAGVLRSIQLGNDPALPFLNAHLSDVFHLDESLLKFVLDNSTKEGTATFSSLQGFIEAFSKADANGVDLVIAGPAWDAAASRFTFEIAGFADQADRSLETGNTAGTGKIAIGDEFAAATGISGIGAKPASTGVSVKDPAYTFRIPVVLDLREGVTGDGCKAHPASGGKACPFEATTTNGGSDLDQQLATTEIVSELPRPADRFLVRTGNGLVQANARVEGPIENVSGQAGFVEVALGDGKYFLGKKDGATHLYTAGLKDRGEVAVGELSRLAATKPADTATTAISAAAGMSSIASIPGEDGFFTGTSSQVNARRDDITTGANSVSAGDGLGRLKPLASVPGGGLAVRGTFTGAVDAVAKSLNDLAGLAQGTNRDRLAAPIQVIGQPFGRFARFPELTAASADLTAAPADTLQAALAAIEKRTGANTTSFDVDTSSTPARLVVGLAATHDLGPEPDLPLGVFSSQGAMVGSGPSGVLDTTGTAEAALSLSIPLDGSAGRDADAVTILPSSKVTLAPVVSVASGKHTAQNGALQMKFGSDAEPDRIAAQPTLTIGGGTGSPVSLRTWAKDAPSQLGGGPVDCGGTGGLAICADLPAFKTDGSPLGDPNVIKVRLAPADVLAAGNQGNVAVPDEVPQARDSAPLPLAEMGNGVKQGLSNLKAGLDQAGKANVPLVGNDIQQGFDAIGDLGGQLGSRFADVPLADGSKKISDIRAALDQIKNGLASNFAITLICKDSNPCADEKKPATDIIDVRVDATFGPGQFDNADLGKGCTGGCATREGRPLSLGIPALRIASKTPIAAKVGWQLNLRFGFDRASGFYLDTAPMHELKVGLNINVPDLAATIAFVNVNSKNVNASVDEFSGTFGIDLGGGKLKLDQLANADPTQLVTPALWAKTRVDWALHADASSNLPGIKALLHVAWDWASEKPGAPTNLEIALQDVRLDLEPLFRKVLGPVTKTLKQAMAPLQPVLDALNAPLPGISDVSRLAGAGDVSLMTLMELLSKAGVAPANFEAIIRAVRLLNDVNNVVGKNEVLIGTFGIAKDKALAGIPTPDQIDDLITGAAATAEKLRDDIARECPDCMAMLDKLTGGVASGAVGGFKFPVIENPRSLAGLLLGQDVPLATYDTGNFHQDLDWGVPIGPIPIPIPVMIRLGLRATIDLRFRAGFDTYGIRKAFEGGATVGDIFDSFYLDDLDEKRVDVNEISITNAAPYVTAEASVGIASAGIEANITLNAFLNLKDKENIPEGRVRLSEIGRDAAGDFDPACIFDMDGDISANLLLFLEVGIKPFKKRFDTTLAKARILDLRHRCGEKKPPTLGTVSGDTLFVNAGERAKFRGAGWEAKPGTENVTVRALHNYDGSFKGFSVDLIQHHKDFLVTEFKGLRRVVVDGGNYTDEMVINILGDGTGPQTGGAPAKVFQFDQSAVVLGGNGRDQIKVDSTDRSTVAVDARDGDDVVITGGSADLVSGGPGADQLNTGMGHDTVFGDVPLGGGSPAYAMTAPADPNAVKDDTDKADGIDLGLGADKAYGGGGDDTINGGANRADAATKPGQDALLDNDNLLVGGPGDDTINGGPGRDEIHGDWKEDGITPDSAAKDGGGADTITPSYGVDKVFAGSGNDRVVGDATRLADTGVASPGDTIYGSGGEDQLGGGDGNDTVYGGPDVDTILGNAGEDTLHGNAGNDKIGGDRLLSERSDFSLLEPVQLPRSDFVKFIRRDEAQPLPDGNDTIFGNADNDTVYGGGADDKVYGDNGTSHCVAPADGLPGSTPPAEVDDAAKGDDTVTGGAGNDVLAGEGGADTMTGDAGDDLGCGHAGNDPVVGGGSGTDKLWGGSGDDGVAGGTGADFGYGNDGEDTVAGGPDADWLEGNGDVDKVVGDSGADHLEGNQAADTVLGGAGEDDVIGGTSPEALAGMSTATATDVGDTLLAGGDDSDVVLGDNGTAGRTADGARRHTMLDLFTIGGGDRIEGDGGRDFLFGAIGSDTIGGGTGHDRAEGILDADVINGGDGEDELLGGSSPLALATGTTTADVPDPGDRINGDGDADVILGDNGVVVRTSEKSKGDGSTLRKVTLLDREAVGGDDLIAGGTGPDRIWAEIGADDVDGGPDADTIEGNLGADRLAGGTGTDDIVGGTTPVALGDADPVAAATNSADVGDTIAGHGFGLDTDARDDDVVLGDNGIIDRCSAGGRDSCEWTIEDFGTDKTGASFGRPYVRFVTLLGESNSPTNHDGDDVIEGNGDNDLLWGINGRDRIHGNNAQDRIWGGYGDDRLWGDAGVDAILGDRGEIDVVPVMGSPAEREIFTEGPPNIREMVYVKHTLWYRVALLDQKVGGADDAFGGQGDDAVHGGAGDDYLQGDAGPHVLGAAASTGGADRVLGDDGDDSIAGGPGRDHLWGGHGYDDIDVIRSLAAPTQKGYGNQRYPTLSAYALAYPGEYDKDTGAEGNDIVFGGYNRDIMQADADGDRLVDDHGNFNLFLVCPAAYGGAQITRALSPGLITFLQELGEADGATGAAESQSHPTTGADEVTIIYPGLDVPQNRGSAYQPGTPGHFTCNA